MMGRKHVDRAQDYPDLVVVDDLLPDHDVGSAQHLVARKALHKRPTELAAFERVPRKAVAIVQGHFAIRLNDLDLGLHAFSVLAGFG